MAVFYSTCTASLSLSVESQLNKNRQTVKKFLKVKRFPFFRRPHRSWDKYMMADIQRIKGFQYVDANQSFSETFFLLQWFNVIQVHVRHFLACGSGNVVLMLDLSSRGSWPSFLHYPASLKTPKPMRPQPKLVDLLCATCHLIQIGPVRQCRAWCHGVIFITRAPRERWNSNSGPDEGLTVANGHWPLQPTVLLQGAAQSRWCCYFQGQKGLNNSSDSIIADQIMWCDILWGYFKAALYLICFHNDITAAVWAPRDELFYALKNTSLQSAGPSNTKSKAHSVSLHSI